MEEVGGVGRKRWREYSVKMGTQCSLIKTNICRMSFLFKLLHMQPVKDKTLP